METLIKRVIGSEAYLILAFTRYFLTINLKYDWFANTIIFTKM